MKYISLDKIEELFERDINMCRDLKEHECCAESLEDLIDDLRDFIQDTDTNSWHPQRVSDSFIYAVKSYINKKNISVHKNNTILQYVEDTTYVICLVQPKEPQPNAARNYMEEFAFNFFGIDKPSGRIRFDCITFVGGGGDGRFILKHHRDWMGDSA